MKDEIFKAPSKHIEDFEFNRDVVEVFDDMANRSVPYYQEVQKLIASLAILWHKSLPICDIGCSTGTTLEYIAKQTDSHIELIGIDRSPEMLEECRKKLTPYMSNIHLDLREEDITKITSLPREKFGVVILSLVLQFIRPIQRQELLNILYSSIAPGGALFLLEKTVDPSKEINLAFIENYYKYKKLMGYNELEISRKREALENRLIPFYPQENISMLKSAGFKETTIFFTWMNFQGYLSLKE